MTAPLTRQLEAFCRRHPVERKVMFVPSRQVGYNLGGALVLSGCEWVNLEFVTPADHAFAIAGPALIGEGFRPANEDARILLVERILDELLDGLPDNYFADVPRSSGLARAFRDTLQSLRLSGVAPEDVAARLTTPKGRFIAAAYHRYVEELAAAGALDDARALARALDLIDGRPSTPARYAILDETPVPGLAGEFVRAVSGGTLVRLGADDIEAPIASHLAGARFGSAPRLEPARPAAPELALRTCVGSENEVREVLRAVLDGGLPFDSVEVAYCGEQPYLARLVDLADRFDVPIAFGAGVPCTMTRPGQAVVGFLRWIAGGFEARDLVSLARGGLLDPILPKSGERALRGYELARQIRLARIVAGREQYINQLLRRASSPLRTDGTLEAMSLRAVEALLDLIDESAEGSVAGLARAAAAFLDRFARVSTERDQVAIESLKDRLVQIEAADCGNSPHPAAASRLVEMLGEHKIEASTARAGALYAVPLARAGYSGRAQLFVVGLDESTFPGSPAEDPLLLDEERRYLSPALMLVRGGPSEQVWHMKRVLASGAERATLFALRTGIHDAREVFPSALFQELAEKNEPIHLPLVAPPTKALDQSEAFIGCAPTAHVRAALDQWYPHLVHGYRARASRKEGFTVFTGYLGAPVPPHLVPGLETPTSASRLEGFVACPYRHFLRDVLRVRPPDDPPVDASIWLTAGEFGGVLHEACRRFMVALQERGDQPDVDAHSGLMDAILEALVTETMDEVPVLNEAAHKADVTRLRRAAQVFLADEARREAVPVAFELSFGEGINGGLNHPDPVVVRLSDEVALTLRGRIDRVDRVDGSFEIWDYKTGSPSRFDEVDLLGGGRNLQWALYAHALTALLRGRDDPGEVRRAGYFFLGDRGHGLRYADLPPSAGHLAALLQPLLEMAREGAFPRLQKENACRFCDYRHVCEGEAQTCKQLRDALNENAAVVPDELPFRDALMQWIEVES